MFKRIIDLGPLGLLKRVAYRANRKLFALRWKRRTLANKTNNLLFYQDISPSDSRSLSFDEFAFDIRESWEKSRFQNTFDETDVERWIDQNPFLLGINWVCPMEIAIRAINWIDWFEKTKETKKLSPEFVKKFIQSLRDHAYYLENNWETSDRPNNHYIADLVGYFYLCCFFKNIKRFQRKKIITYKKIFAQFEHQIHPDGTSYEGSTAYHKLVTEFFLLFSRICDQKLHDSFYKKLDRMVAFIENCKINEREFVQIGDNDSGVVTKGARPKFYRQRSAVVSTKRSLETNFSSKNFLGTSGLAHYPNFGLTIIKKNRWHITFRHPTYQHHQPTGHFHQDELSITLAYGNIPILVDPGSYVYTANAKWRNRMRSYRSHNTFYPQNQPEIDSNIDLFQLPKQTQKDTAQIFRNKDYISIKNSFQNRTRKITLTKKDFLIKDSCKKPLGAEWSLIFHPEITLVQIIPERWEIFYKKNKLLILTSSLNFSLTEGFYSPEYGVVQPTQKLKSATAFLNSSRFHELKFSPASKIKMP